MPHDRKPETLTGDATLELPEFRNPPPDPIELLDSWVESAIEGEVREPLAVVLATAGADGAPSTRIVLIKSIDSRGVTFGTHLRSRKGREADESPSAAGTLYWRETMQQINFAGHLEALSPAESDSLFQNRAELSRASAIASRQSETLEDESALRAATDEVAVSGRLDRPDTWGGFRLAIERIEFWHGSRDRLHRRLEYSKSAAGWTSRRLQP